MINGCGTCFLWLKSKEYKENISIIEKSLMASGAMFETR